MTGQGRNLNVIHTNLKYEIRFSLLGKRARNKNVKVRRKSLDRLIIDVPESEINIDRDKSKSPSTGLRYIYMTITKLNILKFYHKINSHTRLLPR